MILGGRRWLALVLLAGFAVAAVLLLPRPAGAAAVLVVLALSVVVVRPSRPSRAPVRTAPIEPSQPPQMDTEPQADAEPRTEAAPPTDTEPPPLTPMLDALPLGVLLLDDELTVLGANRAMARIVQHPLEAMVGSSLIRATREIELVGVAREPPGEPRDAHLTGGLEVRVTAAPIDLALTGGRATLLLAVEDVTQLHAAQRARSDLVANLSHELRTPLAGARAIAETFQTAAEDPEERAHFLGLLHDEIERMSNLVERMLRLAQIESQLEPLELEALTPRDLLEAAAARAMPVAAQRDIRVEVEHAIERPVAASRDRIAEVLGNLVDNALRHSPDGSRITLAAHPDEHGVRFEVRDEGPGILPNERERIFERFYTGDAARDASGGTGLGLAIARQLVQQHGGRIWVADRTPGATVCFSLRPAETLQRWPQAEAG